MTLSLGWSIVLALVSGAFAAGGGYMGVRVCLREHGRRIGALELEVREHDRAIARLERAGA